MMHDFNGKTVWITGASSGIGEALAYELANRGARLVLSARNEAELRRVQKNCRSPERHQVVRLDLEQYGSLDVVAEEVWKTFGPIDVLINNAGLSQRYLGVEATLELDEKIMNINFFGTVALTRPILRHMLARGSGQIAVVSSVLGLYGIQTRTAYAASKHALRGYFESLRNELFKTPIQLTMIYPGYVTTKVSHNALRADGKAYGKLDEGHKRGISPEDCAKRIASAMLRKKSTVIIAGPKELFGVFMARFAPGIFRALSPRLKV
jgi:dehydrogenase/reductase SDR family protein 7B